ncbi:MAG: DUF3368 domain-containing protein [Methanocellales archaeon]|nr:DUF3368 domain-containing protein [Methanocellales archaeon]
MKAVINASPMIFLAKLGKLNLLSELFEEIFAPEEVLNEVLKGSEEGFKDALSVKTQIERHKIKKVEVTLKYELKILGLHVGELAVLSYARENYIENVIVDDYSAIKAAKYFGLRPISTPFILLKALKDKNISYVDFKDSLDELIEQKYRISPRLYTKILEKARDVSQSSQY